MILNIVLMLCLWLYYDSLFDIIRIIVYINIWRSYFFYVILCISVWYIFKWGKVYNNL